MIFLKFASIDHAWTFVQAAGQLEMFRSLGRCLLPSLCDGRYGRVVLRTRGGGNHTFSSVEPESAVSRALSRGFAEQYRAVDVQMSLQVLL